MLQELGGWATLDMLIRYAHLDPGHLAQYAEITSIGPAPVTKSDTVEPKRKKA
jgi:hypothetical protein